MNKLHICFVESGYPHPHGGGGGAGTRIQLISRELIQRGHKVTVLTSFCDRCPPISSDEGITIYRQQAATPVHWYWSKLPVIGRDALSIRYLEQGYHYSRTLNQLHRVNPIDIVEYTEGGDFWHAWSASFSQVSFLSGSRYTFLKESGRPVTRNDWWHRRLELMFISRVDHIIAPSEVMRDLVQRELGTVLSNITVLPNPADLRLLERQSEPADMSRNEPPMIMFAARNDWVKGGDLLLQAVSIVHSAFPNVQFAFFGYAAPSNATTFNKVTFYHFVSKDELLRHYRRATICVVPSRWDNSPNTVYEAMAAGKPVVATRVGGIPEIVKDGETGLLIEPNNSEKLAQSLIYLLSNKQLIQEMGQRGQQWVKRHFDLKHHVDLRVQLYCQIVQAKHK